MWCKKLEKNWSVEVLFSWKNFGQVLTVSFLKHFHNALILCQTLTNDLGTKDKVIL